MRKKVIFDVASVTIWKKNICNTLVTVHRLLRFLPFFYNFTVFCNKTSYVFFYAKTNQASSESCIVSVILKRIIFFDR